MAPHKVTRMRSCAARLRGATCVVLITTPEERDSEHHHDGRRPQIRGTDHRLAPDGVKQPRPEIEHEARCRETPGRCTARHRIDRWGWVLSATRATSRNGITVRWRTLMLSRASDTARPVSCSIPATVITQGGACQASERDGAPNLCPSTVMTR